MGQQVGSTTYKQQCLKVITSAKDGSKYNPPKLLWGAKATVSALEKAPGFCYHPVMKSQVLAAIQSS